jgi:uncharacterized protein YciI
MPNSENTRSQYMYVMHPVDPSKAANPALWTAEDEESFNLHWSRLVQATQDGIVLVAGRAQDAEGNGPAIVIFEADSEDDAQRFFESEPFITRGFATGRLHPFAIVAAKENTLLATRDE